MSAADNTPWLNEGSIRVRYREEQGHLVKEFDQPDRDIILGHVAELRKCEQTKKEGWLIGSIPTLDYERVVLPKYPEFRHGDAEQRKRALIRFSNDPDMSIYLVKKA
jgi:hypothetical protein